MSYSMLHFPIRTKSNRISVGTVWYRTTVGHGCALSLSRTFLASSSFTSHVPLFYPFSYFEILKEIEDKRTITDGLSLTDKVLGRKKHM